MRPLTPIKPNTFIRDSGLMSSVNCERPKSSQFDTYLEFGTFQHLYSLHMSVDMASWPAEYPASGLYIIHMHTCFPSKLLPLVRGPSPSVLCDVYHNRPSMRCDKLATQPCEWQQAVCPRKAYHLERFRDNRIKAFPCLHKIDKQRIQL